jgi:copper(I)-binding protein
MRALALVLALAFAVPAAAQISAPIVEDAWVMAPMPSATEAAVYLSIRNASGDRLLGASCDCATRADMHDMRLVDGVMQMRPMRYGLAADENGALSFRAGGAHIMLVGLANRLRPGDRVRLRLTFEDAGVVEAEAVVRRPGAHQHH